MHPGTLAVAVDVAWSAGERHRPTLALMRGLAPAAHEIVAAASLIDPASAVGDHVASDLAGCACHSVASLSGLSLIALRAELQSQVVRAVELCWSVHDAFRASVEARQLLSRAQTAGQRWRLRARAEAMNHEWAKLLIKACLQVKVAEGVAQAVDVAAPGNPWTTATADRGDRR